MSSAIKSSADTARKTLKNKENLILMLTEVYFRFVDISCFLQKPTLIQPQECAFVPSSTLRMVCVA